MIDAASNEKTDARPTSPHYILFCRIECVTRTCTYTYASPGALAHRFSSSQYSPPSSETGDSGGRHCLQCLFMIAPADGGIDDGESGVPFSRDDGGGATEGLITDTGHRREMVLGNEIPESRDVGAQPGRRRTRDREHYREARERAKGAR